MDPANMCDQQRRHYVQMAARRQVTLEFSDVCLQIQGKDVLKSVEGVAKPGQILAVMGPSGSGKTLLLTSLAGRQKNLQSGRILLNGKQINKQLRRQISFVLQDDVFLDQLTLKDTLMFTAHLRLPGSMSYQEKLKKVENIVDTLDLRKCLDTKIGNTLERGLSGGEKKRANIGCELLTDPSILLLDEPTSGLDSHTASELIETLKKYSLFSGKTVITSIHQPSSNTFHLFDRLLLLSEGEVVYFGQTCLVTDYFARLGLYCPQHYNPADFIIDKMKGKDNERTILHGAARNTAWTHPLHKHHPSVRAISGEMTDDDGPGLGHYNRALSVGSLADVNPNESVFISMPVDEDGRIGHTNIAMLVNPNPNTNCSNSPHVIRACQSSPKMAGKTGGYSLGHLQNASDDIEKWPTGFWSQLTTLTHRNFKQNRGVILSKLQVIKQICLASIVGALWFQVPHVEESVRDLVGMVFFLAAYWGFESIFGVLTSFPAERNIINKERSSGAYRLSSYFLSKIIGDFPLEVAITVAAVTISYWMVGLNNSVIAFICFVGTAVLYTQAGRSIGLFLSAVASSDHEAIILASLTMLSCMLLAGFYVERLPAVLQWVRYISFTSYGYGAFLSTVLIVVPQHVRCSTTVLSDFAECLAPNATNSTSISGSSIVQSYAGIFLPIWSYYLALVAYIVTFNTLAYLVLRFYKKPS